MIRTSEMGQIKQIGFYDKKSQMGQIKQFLANGEQIKWVQNHQSVSFICLWPSKSVYLKDEISIVTIIVLVIIF